MPYYLCEVDSLEQVRRQGTITSMEAGDDRKVEWDALVIRSRFSKKNLRPWGLQLYAVVGIVFLPLVIDTLWFHFGLMGNHHVQLVKPMKTALVSRCNTLTDQGVFLPIALCAYVGNGLIGLFCSLLGCAFVLVGNLVSALRGEQYIGNRLLKMRKMSYTNADGEEVWELVTELSYGHVPGEKDFGPKFGNSWHPPLFPIDHLSVGDMLKVGFGPFEYWCVFA